MKDKSLDELAQIFYGKDYKANPEGENVPIYGTGGLMGFTSRKLNTGPAVLSGRKGSINNPIYLEGDFWNVDTIFCIKANPGIDTKWLYYNFQNTDLTKLNEATGVPSVNTQSLYKLRFRYFDLPQQQKIAKILSTCDEVIEKTEAAIAKYKAIKQGMMQDLFTRGIDVSTGKLRPSYQEAPELYKASELGMIPKEWEVKRLEEFVTMKSGNGITSKDIDSMGEYPVFGGNGLRGFTNTFTHNGEYVIIGRQGALCGNVLKVRGIFYASEHAVVVIIMGHGNYDWLAKKLDFMQLNQYSEASAQPGLAVNKILKLLVTVQKNNEQNSIAYSLLSLDKKLQAEESSLSKYKKLKEGLMQDLLTGKVEVSE
jgi:type I restriction enzyme S subunit